MAQDLVGALGSFGSGLVGYHSAKNLAEYQNKLNLEQWERENAYNSPKAQMARFAEAGLNPNLIVGQQNLSAPSPSLVGGSPMDMSGVIGSVRQGALVDSQIELNQANAKKALGEDNLSKSIINLNLSKEELNRLYGDKVTEETENLRKTRENIIALTEKYKAEAKLTDLKSVEQFINNMFADERNHAQINKWVSECEKNNADAKETLTLLMARLCNINADTYLKGKQASEANNMAAVLYNAYSTGKIDLQFIQDHPRLHSFGQGAKEVIPSITALGDVLGEILPFGLPTKRIVNVVKP